jgi:hypothetical protein
MILVTTILIKTRTRKKTTTIKNHPPDRDQGKDDRHPVPPAATTATTATTVDLPPPRKKRKNPKNPKNQAEETEAGELLQNAKHCS